METIGDAIIFIAGLHKNKVGSKIMKAAKHKHLRLEDRIAIEAYLDYGINITGIAKRVQKDRTTLAKEIKRSRYHIGNGKQTCPLLDKSPYVCNGCDKKVNYCLYKYVYTGSVANNEYLKTLKSSRSHLRITRDEIHRLDEIVSPLMIEKHHSVNQVYINYGEILPFCKSTFYRYIDCGILAVRNIDLARKVRYKIKKNMIIQKRLETQRFE